MRVRHLHGLPSIVFLGLVAASGCTQPTADSTGSVQQAVTGSCHLSTLGAACDPDGDGPLGACDGTCVTQGGPAGGAYCTVSSIAINEGLPCGGLDNDHVDCNSSCRRGVCTKRNADEDTECMPSGATLVSAICEGACHAGTCDKLYHPKRCSDSDAGVGSVSDGGDTGATNDDAGALGQGDDSGMWMSDTGASGGGDTGTAGGGDTGAADDTGASGTDDSGGTGEGDDTGAIGGDDTGGTGEGDDAGFIGEGDDTGASGGADTGSASADSGGWWGPKVNDSSPSSNDNDAGMTPSAETGTGDTGGCGCHTAGTSSSTTTAGVFAAIAIAFARLRRRRA